MAKTYSGNCPLISVAVFLGGLRSRGLRHRASALGFDHSGLGC